MKHSPEMHELIERMAPGVLSLHGFLGSGRRPLEEILDTDSSTVAELATTHRALAQVLANVLETASEGLGSHVPVDDHLTASLLEVKGRIPCPWDDGLWLKGEVTLTDCESGDELIFTPLNVHMIAEHGFYEGRGSRYRIEPDLICRMFRMGPADRPAE